MNVAARHARRRNELVAAMRAVARERGIGGSNVRAVAAEAQMSPGSVLYYFDGFEQLQFAAVEGVLEEFDRRRRELADRLPDPVDRLRALVSAGIPDEISADLRIVYESIALLRERPQYLPLHRSIVERQVMLYRSTLDLGVGLGVFRPAQPLDMIARNLVALEDAYDLYPLVGVEVDRAAARHAVLGYAALALECPEIAA